MEIAGYNDGGSPVVVMFYATDPTALTANAIPKQFFPHRLIISVTADNLVEAITNEYELGFDVKGAFYMKKMEGAIGDGIKNS